MRVLLDECLPRRLSRHLTGHQVRTVPEAGWSGRRNGDLLRLCAGTFDAFVTIDRSLAHEQNLTGLTVGVIALSARSNRLGDLIPLVPAILEALERVEAGRVIRVGS